MEAVQRRPQLVASEPDKLDSPKCFLTSLRPAVTAWRRPNVPTVMEKGSIVPNLVRCPGRMGLDGARVGGLQRRVVLAEKGRPRRVHSNRISRRAGHGSMATTSKGLPVGCRCAACRLPQYRETEPKRGRNPIARYDQMCAVTRHPCRQAPRPPSLTNMLHSVTTCQSPMCAPWLIKQA